MRPGKIGLMQDLLRGLFYQLACIAFLVIWVLGVLAAYSVPVLAAVGATFYVSKNIGILWATPVLAMMVYLNIKLHPRLARMLRAWRDVRKDMQNGLYRWRMRRRT